MPRFSVYIEADELFEDISDKELIAELDSRHVPYNRDVNHCIPLEVAAETCEEAARILRKLGRVDLAFKLDETRNDYLTE